MLGSLCISIDLELGWGIWDKPNADYFGRCVELEQQIVHGLLELFDRYEVSATWAIVGRLLDLDDKKASESSYGRALWFAPHLIDKIRGTTTEQDIGSHSFAHIYFDEAPREQVRADLQAAREVHDRFGLPFESFVFPRNGVAHVDLLQEFGVKVYRSVDIGWHANAERFGRMASRVAHLASQATPLAPEVVKATRHGDIVELPSSMLFMARNGVRGAIPPAVTIAKTSRALRTASSAGGCFHLWFHPSNFYYRTEQQFETFEAILVKSVALRDRGLLEIKPMRAFA